MQAARDLLHQPELFAGQSAYQLAARVICIWIANSFRPQGSWSIFKAANGEDYVLRRLVIEYGSDEVYCDEAPIDPALVGEILASFEALQVPAFRRPRAFGLDGGSQGISFGDTWRGTTMQWWSACGDEWEALAHACSSARMSMERLLANRPRSGMYF